MLKCSQSKKARSWGGAPDQGENWVFEGAWGMSNFCSAGQDIPSSDAHDDRWISHVVPENSSPWRHSGSQIGLSISQKPL